MVPEIGVWGCHSCGAIYSRQLYFSVSDQGSEFCPECGQRVQDMGPLPYFVKSRGGVYLMGKDGTTTGPYRDQLDAQSDLWAWFKRKDEHAKDLNQEVKASHLRLVATQGPSD